MISPGPWKPRGNAVWTDSPGVPFKIATTTRTLPANGHDAEANARLIAAAPDLLDIAREILARLDLEYADRQAAGASTVFPCAAVRDDLRAAIQKAEEE